MKKALLAGTLSAAALLALGSASRAPRKAAPSPLAFAITHASVVPMDSERVLLDHTIVVVGDRIAAVGPDGLTSWPAGATVVDAGGAYVAPGLADMHVHIRRRELRAYVDAGITSVRNMWGYETLPATMRDIESRAVVGPMIYSASQGIDASPGVWPETQFVNQPSQAEAVVAAQAAAGWRFLKVYDSLSAPSYDAIADAARRSGIRFVGHVPDSVSIEHALESGQLSIEHLRGYDHALTRTSQSSHVGAWADIDGSRIPDLAARTAAAGAWNCPTMAIYSLLTEGMAAPTRAQIFANRAAVLRAFRDAGARILAGSDAGIDRTAVGTSLHDELALLAEAGLSPYEALEAATSGAAAFLGEEAEFGTIQPGRRADLVLMDGNPLETPAALRAIKAVVLRGAWRSLDGSRSPLVPRVPGSSVAPRAVARPTR